MSAWEDVVARVGEIDALEQVAGLLEWDQQTGMPPAAGPGRGQQSALVARLLHERVTDPALSELADAIGADEDPIRRAASRLLRRRIDRATCVPASLVAAIAEAQNDAFTSWIEAKSAADFSRFEPALRRIFALVRERAAAIDGSKPVYDVLLDEYDPGSTSATVLPTFRRLEAGLVELVDAIRGAPAVDVAPASFPIDAQRSLHDRVIRALGYDLSAGAVALAEHPFTVRVGSRDVRITTHFFEDDLLFGLGGTIHETGHALYEQGLPDIPVVGTAASMGLHESQSRFWENFIGGSRPFMGWLAGEARATLGPDAPSADALFRGWNRVEPSLIRIRADEVTYNFHILVRTELEIALFEGRLDVADLPGAWNDAYRRLLGVVPPDDARGVLQDVHWATGAFGYFPSYTLGNLYMAALGRRMASDLPALWDEVGAGRFASPLAWLRERVHAPGASLDAPDRMRAIVGDVDLVEELLGYLWGRHGELYGVRRPTSR